MRGLAETFTVIGFGLLCGGLYLYDMRIALVTGGVLMLFAGWRMAR